MSADAMESPLARVIVTAGGTGGHIFPGLAVAHFLRQQGVEIHWVGTSYGLETKLVPQADFPIEYLPIRGLRGKGLLRYLAIPFMLLISVWKAFGIVRRFKPQAVLSLGGYASAPVGFAAWLCRVPLVLHEQNAAPGWTNQVLAPFATRILSGFPNGLARFKSYQVVGNPVREAFVGLHQQRKAAPASFKGRDEINILVIGGSQGAARLNQYIPRALKEVAQLCPEKKLKVLHQTGTAQRETTGKNYKSSGLDVEVVAFIDDMAAQFAWAHLVISRAGAMSVAEIAAAGLAALFIPLAIAVDDHQTKNAMTLVQQSAAMILAESELGDDKLKDSLLRLVRDDQFRDDTANRALECAKVSATQDIYDILTSLCADFSSKHR